MDDGLAHTTVLGPHCRISGELSLERDAVVQGKFAGELRVGGVLELAASAEVSGTIEAQALRLAGHAEANIVAEESVELMPGSYLSGEVRTGRFNVVEGAVFQGQVHVGPTAMGQQEDASRSTESPPIEEPPIVGSIRGQAGPANAILGRRRAGLSR